MDGAKIALVKETLKFVVNQLKSEDYFGVVLYDSNVEVLLRPLAMDAEGKRKALLAADGIVTKGTTNLSGGLFQGLSEISKSPSKNEVSALLLFTDGLANAGVTKTEQILKGVENLRNGIRNPLSCFTFGYGTDHDDNMLTQIADSGCGLYYYIQDEAAIPQAFADCLGGLLSVCAQNLKLKIESSMKSQVEIKKIFGKFKLNVVSSGQAYEVYLNDLYSEESRDIMFLVSIPKLGNSAENSPLIDLTLTYDDLVSGSKNNILTSTVTVNRSQNVVPSAMSLDLDQQMNRIQTADVMDQAKSLGNLGRFEEARNLVENCWKKVVASPSNALPLTSHLAHELESMTSHLHPVAYKQTGAKMLSNALNSHYQQRSASSSTNPYTTNAKIISQKAAKSLTSKVPAAYPAAPVAYPAAPAAYPGVPMSFAPSPMPHSFNPNYIPSPRLPADFRPSPVPYYPPPMPTMSHVVPNVYHPSHVPVASTHRRRLYVGNNHQIIPDSEAKESTNTPGKIENHRWTMFVRNANPSDANCIEKVVFRLHPLITPSVVTITQDPFELTQNGWGIFPVKVEIHFLPQFKKQPLMVTHKLSFEKGGAASNYDVDL
eukprot:TRINITY_DN8554_c0_g2_i1.p1 TRINITY_DN8554_c0_g2~~TRINITY_DN8554_c0_g2_i1.p1  ORF type:complete len:681 (-),score=165.79 TRINITY_DN8554_c0_g2_i1:30-1832(-)